MKITSLIEMARSYSVTLTNRDFKHVSIILRQGHIMAIGTNRRKTHPLSQKYNYRFGELHSELDALRQIRRTQRDKLILINFRFNKRGDLKLSNPCSQCSIWCYDAFDRIFASQNDGVIKQLK